MSPRYPALLAAVPFAVGVFLGGSFGGDGSALGRSGARAGWIGTVVAGAIALTPVASASRPAAVVAALALGALRGADGAPAPLPTVAPFASETLWLGRVSGPRPGGFRLGGARPAGLKSARGRLPGLVDVFAPEPAPAIGSLVVVRGALATIDFRRNPGLPDPRQLARRDRVVARIVSEDPARLLAPPGRWARASSRLAAWRARFAAREDALYPADAAAFLRALFLGDRTLLDAGLRADFRDTGAAHLLALSGQHVVLIAFLIARGLTLLRVPRPLHLPVSLLALGVYLTLVGAPSSVARAGVVLALFLLAEPLRRRSEPGNTLGVALLVLLALHPEGLWDAGLTLSFGATAGLVFLLPVLRARLFPNARGAVRHVLEPVRVTLAATWPLVPLEGAYFGAIPIVGVATNIVLVPATGLLLGLHVAVLAFAALPLAAVGIPSPARDLAATATLLSRATVAAVHFFARVLPPPAPVPDAWLPFAVLFALATWVVLFPPRGAERDPALAAAPVLALPLVALVLAAAPGRPPLRVTVFDVGQGDAILVEGPARRFLVDAGPAWSQWDSGERIVAPALRARGIRTLDALVLSHRDADHCGGGAAVFAGVRVARLCEPDPDAPPGSRIHARTRDAAARAGAPDLALRQGDALDLGGRARPRGRPLALARVLHPACGPLASGAEPGGNNRSIQLDVACGRVHVLLTGDLPAEEEPRLVREGLLPRGAILKVAHHGSRGSTSEPYLDAIRPPVALISVGAKNRYHHPHAALLARLAAAGARVVRTDECGAIVVESDGIHAIVRAMAPGAAATRLVYLAPDDPRPAGPLSLSPVSAVVPASD